MARTPFDTERETTRQESRDTHDADVTKATSGQLVQDQDELSLADLAIVAGGYTWPSPTYDKLRH